MLFNSIHFVLFFLVVVPVNFLLPSRIRWIWLLAAGYYFYMCWRADYIVLILISTGVTYFCALGLSATVQPARRKLLLGVSLCVNLGILFVFKYFNFVMGSLRQVCAHYEVPLDIPVLHVVLPVGISFYTFQAVAYTVDVYRGVLEPERRLGLFALYKCFWPQLVAGPIERPAHLLPQLAKTYSFDAARFWDGLHLIGWGLFKKVVIADRLAIYVDTVYNNVPYHGGPSYLVATYLFAFQIYCDFSGYSDIAVGCAKILGIDLVQNFNRPYFATTITDFWRRWHISLSTWLRDYLYIPLGGNRKGTSRMYVNLMITMFLGGIWHGASWTFVIWGTLQGIMLCLSKATLPHRDRLCERLRIPRPFVLASRMLVTFHLVCLSWVFFRANTVGDAFYILRHLFDGWPRLFLDPMVLSHGIPALGILLLVQIWQTRRPVRESVARLWVPARWALYAIVVFAIVLFGVDGGSQFIYFQF